MTLNAHRPAVPRHVQLALSIVLLGLIGLHHLLSGDVHPEHRHEPAPIAATVATPDHETPVEHLLLLGDLGTVALCGSILLLAAAVLLRRRGVAMRPLGLAPRPPRVLGTTRRSSAVVSPLRSVVLRC